MFVPEKSEYFTNDYMFKCSDGVYISYMFICDGKKDCPGEVSSDEIGCECNTTLNYTSQCKLIKTLSQECSDFYFKSWNNKCMLFEVSFVNGKGSDTRAKSKASLGSVGVQQPINDNQWKEIKLGNLSCQSIELLKPTLYEISEICAYRLNEQGHLVPCNKGEHLQDCQQFECNMMFKCPDFYCIPWDYVCDGKWDCPSGHDESIYHQCGSRACTNMFKCKMSSTCLHLGDVCDGLFNCPYQDDEHLCLLKNILCSTVCYCLAFAIRCYDVNILEDTLSIHLPYIVVTMLSCTLFTEDKLKTFFQYVSFLFITNTNLKKVCDVVSLMKHIQLLDSSKNSISTIKSHCFKNKFALKVIKLHDNVLHYIQKFAFYNLTNILYIDLSNNMLTVIFKYSIVGSVKLSFLSLQNTTLDVRRSKYMLNNLNLKFLQIEYFSLCCSITENFESSAKKPWHISCSPLLVNNVFNYTLYFMSFAVIILNVLHLLLQKKHEGERQNVHTAKTFDGIVFSISITDIIGPIPLFILWISDLHFKGDIVFVQSQWQSSLICFISNGINMYYVLASPFLYNLLSYTRYDVVKDPIDSNSKNTDYIHKIILVGCSFSLLFATLSVTLFWLNYNGTPTRFCDPLFDPSRRFSLTEYLAWFIINVHIIAISFNFIVHLNLVAKVTMVQNLCFGTQTKNQSKKFLIIQIACISCSHLLCWIPGIVILLIANLWKTYPMEMILWKLSCVSPLNSILFPFIFIIKK